MLSLTNSAVNQIKEFAESENLKPTIRVKVIGGGCFGLSNDLFFEEFEPTDFDEIFTQDGVTIICDQLSLQYISGTTIDYENSIMSSGFKFINPNLKSTCGCGSSYNV